MHIETYTPKYKNEIISLILNIQNNESKINLSLEEQPDLLDISKSYQQNGGEFWLALSDGKVIGTIGLMLKENNCAIMKKFFVKKEFRSQKVGLALYQKLLNFATNAGVEHIILDTPSVAHASHKFYEKAGFKRIEKADLPIPYTYPDRDSLLYILDCTSNVKIYEVGERTPELLQKLLTIWEASVRATHLFLSDAEVLQIKEYVPQALTGVEHLIIAEDEAGEPIAFMGTENERLEMLFLSPAQRGNGIGRQFIQFGIQNYGINEVTVNEQNPQAVGFYEHLGFKTYKRTDCDEEGNPYPLLYMKLM